VLAALPKQASNSAVQSAGAISGVWAEDLPELRLTRAHGARDEVNLL
jgi:hypothetical protein